VSGGACRKHRIHEKYRILVQKFEGRPFPVLSTALEKILKKQDVRMWTGFIWLRIGSTGGLLQHVNKPFGSIKGEVFLD
jgi:hypothetical protein